MNDMQRLQSPLGYYFIKSSSDTLFSGGTVGISNLVKALKNNYQRIELLVSEDYKGKKSNLVCRCESASGSAAVKLDKCLRAIGQHGNLSRGPLILALKIDCDFQGQILLSESLEKHLGEKLFVPKSKLPEFHSPYLLQGKVVLWADIQYEDKENGRLNMAKELRRLVYIESVSASSMSQPKTAGGGWSGAYATWQASKPKASQFHASTKSTLCNVDTDSNLFGLWYHGIQCVSMLDTANDFKTWVYDAMFSRNNACGYTAKPQWMISPGSKLPEQYTSLEKKYLRLQLTNITAAETGRWQVVVSVVGCQASFEYKSAVYATTKVIDMTAKQANTWTACLSTLQLSVIVIELKNHSVTGGDTVGYHACSCDQLKNGVTKVALKSPTGKKMKASVQLVVKWQ
eukprot:m.44746 g.44746  ORF g.44746 m.44746 type:complete len:401 (-) comp19766_c0_seq1:313-1515(-)